MKNVLLCLIVATATTGCLNLDRFISNNRMNIARLEYGMSKAEVSATMGTKRVRGFTNPHTTDLYRTDDGDTIEVLSYWTDGKKHYGVTDDELTPVVLVNGSVIGWGRRFYGDYVQKMDIRIRH